MREQDLDDLFTEARTQAPLESGPLMARVLADAAQHQPHPRALVRPRAAPPKSGFWAGLAAALGGGRVIAGLGTVAVAGVMLGFVQPASLSALTNTIFTQAPLDEVDLIPGIDAILTEG